MDSAQQMRAKFVMGCGVRKHQCSTVLITKLHSHRLHITEQEGNNAVLSGNHTWNIAFTVKYYIARYTLPLIQRITTKNSRGTDL